MSKPSVKVGKPMRDVSDPNAPWVVYINVYHPEKMPGDMEALAIPVQHKTEDGADKSRAIMELAVECIKDIGRREA